LVPGCGRGKKQQEREDPEDQRTDHPRQFGVNHVSAKGACHYHH